MAFTPESLIGKLSDKTNKQAQFERHVAKMLLTRAGLSKRDVIDASKAGRPLDTFYEQWLSLGGGTFPFVVAPVLVESFNFLDIFTRPTRSIVVETYKELAETHAEPGRPVAMAFQAYEIGVLVAVPHGTADVPSLSVPPWCMVLHFDRWMNKIVGVNREPE